MENFGDRLSRRRHLARRPVRQDDPERHARRRTTFPSRPTTSPGSHRRSCSPGSKWRQKLADNAAFDKAAVTDPFMQEAMRVFPGLSPGDSFLINDGKTPLSPRGRGGRDQDDLRATCSTAPGPTPGARREAAAGVAEGNSADRAGAAVRRRLRHLALARGRALVLPAAALAHDQPETSSRIGSWRTG